MTVNELVDQIADELNIGGNIEARTRISRKLNNRYKQVTSAIGMAPTRRSELNATATIGSRFITFSSTEKLEIVYRKVGTKKIRLDELTSDEMKEAPIVDEPARNYAIYSNTQSTITLELDCIPTTAFILYATGITDVSTLTNLDKPAIPESFHDVLIHGVLADEYKRKNALQYAKDEELMFMSRLSDLRMFVAKSGFVTIYRSKNTASEAWWDESGAGLGD